ncbi:MAG: septum formation protein [Gammaproteobacteria bacterium]|jgi:septum formation protein
MDLILASTSPYRRQLLMRLGLKFSVQAPGIIEVAHPGEHPHALAQRLADEKANAVALKQPGALVIGSDQLACLGETVLGKPDTQENAEQQLLACSGREVVFLTALNVCCHARGRTVRVMDETRVQFRELSTRLVRRYVELEQPLDCAGSFKVEGLGISLFTGIHTSDPSALIGLPLIKLCTVLSQFGIEPLEQ